MREHAHEVCVHGRTVMNCRCASPDKKVVVVACPPACDVLCNVTFGKPPGKVLGCRKLRGHDGRCRFVGEREA